MPSRNRNYHNTHHEKSRATKLLRDFYRQTYGETIGAIHLKETGAIRKANGYLYIIDRDGWTAGMRACRLAQIKREGKFYLVGFDVELDANGTGKDKIVSLTEWGKKDGTAICFHGMGKRFAVTKVFGSPPAIDAPLHSA